MADRSPTMLQRWNGLRLSFGRPRNVRRPGPVLALDLDSEVVRVAQVVLRGQGPAVTRVAVAPLTLKSEADRTDPAAMGAALAAALDGLRLKGSQVVMGVPRHLVVLRTLSLPQVDDVRELASMVHLQIAKDLPFPMDEAVVDFKVHAQTRSEEEPAADGSKGGSEPQVKVSVLVAAIRRDTVEFYQKVAAAAKVKLIALGWLSQANARCVEACEVAETPNAVALISLRPTEVGVDIVAQGALLFSRGAGLRWRAEGVEDPGTGGPGAEPLPGTAESSEPLSYVEAATIEVVRSLHSHAGMESEATVSKLVVAGATGQEAAVLESLQKRLQLPCSLLDPARALDLPKAAREQAADAVGAIGLGLGVNDAEGLPFDFLHPKRPAVQRDTRRIRTLALCTAGAVLLTALLGVRAHLVQKRQRIYNALDDQYKKAATQLPLYRRMQQQAATVQQWTKDGRNWLDHLAYLSAVLPGCEEIYITSLSVGAQGSIHLAVQARSGEVLAQLDKRLRAAGYQVKPLAITPGNDKFGYSFRTTVELAVPPGMKIDLANLQTPPRPEDDGSLESKNPPRRRGGRS